MDLEGIARIEGILDQMNGRKWNPLEFVTYVTAYRNVAYPFSHYTKGHISLEEFISRAES